MARLLGKVALVTGGNSGIGRAIALRFAKEGAAVAIAARRLEASLALVREIETQRGKAMAIAMDVTDARQVEAGFAEVLRRYGRVDILVNSAGIWHFGPIAEATEEVWRQVLDTNLKGPFLSSRAYLRHHGPEEGGYILNIASMAGLEAWEGTGVYSASKFGLVGLSQALAAEGAAAGIKVCAICPGMVDTPLVMGLDATERRALLRAEDVADAALYLVTLGPNVLVPQLVLARKGAS